MIEIIPAILPKSVTDLEIKLARIQDIGGTVQIDMVDGVFANNKTWPYSAPGSFEAFIEGDEGLPFWREFDFQFDVMAAHPEADIEKYVRAGASGIVLHAKAPGALIAVQLLQQYREIELTPVAVGIALMPDTSLEELVPFAGLYDFVQVMGIARVGFQGEAFDERVISLIEKLKSLHPEIFIQVDGGIDMSNARALAKAGAKRLVVGHDILEADDPVEEVSRLRRETDI